jgi:hypothetical protein
MITNSLRSILNNESKQHPKFNWDGYNRFIADNFTIIDKDKQEVPFKSNPPQLDFLQHMAEYYNLLILKARKMGFSSTALGVATAKFITGRNERCVSMSFDQTASDKQLARAKHFIKSYEEINKVKIPLKYNSKSEMVWEGMDEQGKRFTNALRVGTAKSNSFGRGDDITFLHLTEVAFCDDVETLMAGVGEACIHGAHKILETTANGYNSYKTYFDEAMMNLKGFAVLFYSPHWEYDDSFLAQKAKELGRLYYQEYPQNPEEAFIASGQHYFESLAMKDILENVKRWEANHVLQV